MRGGIFNALQVLEGPALSHCLPLPPQMPANVVLVTIDSLRASHLSAYGYHKPTSPHLDALAREGIRFENAFAAGIPTMPSFTTLLSGLHPLRHGITAHASSQRVPPEVQFLAQYFKKLGYATAAVDNLATQAHGRGSWFARGFDYYSSFLYAPFSNQCEQLAERAVSFFEQLHERPFLLWIHLWDPHTPYAPPPPFDEMHYRAGESGKSLEEVKAVAPEYYDEFLRDMKLKHDDYDWVVAQYDGEISYVDSQVERLFKSLKSLGVWDDAHVLALGDHGEAFGEGGVEFDHHGLFDAVTRIPLIWKPARGFAQAPSTCDALVSHEDILPTLLEVAGGAPLLEAAASDLTGRSFAPVLLGQEFEGREQVVLVESTRQCSVGLRTPDWKLIQPIAQTSDGRALPDLYGRPRNEAPLLFDLRLDPGEENDVADEHPQVRDEMLATLDEFRARERSRSGVEPLDYGLSLPFDEFMARLSSRKLRG